MGDDKEIIPILHDFKPLIALLRISDDQWMKAEFGGQHLEVLPRWLGNIQLQNPGIVLVPQADVSFLFGTSCLAKPSVLKY